MAKVTSKLQVTIPKAIAEQYGIVPGDEIDFVPAGDAIRVLPSETAAQPADPTRRLALFDDATRRQRARERARQRPSGAGRGRRAARGWTREELYERGGTD